MSYQGPCEDDCPVCGEPQAAPFGRFTGGQPMTREQAIAHWSRWHVDHRRALRETIGEYRQTQTRCS